MSNGALPEGKLDAGVMKDLLADLPLDDSVRVPPGVGLDAAGLRVHDRHVAVAVDPITFATDRPATYSLAVNINDVVCQGCEPRWYTASVLLPAGSTRKDLRDLWTDLVQAVRRHDVSAVSGHTEVTGAVNRPLITGQIIGVPLGEEFLDPRRAAPGDRLFLWRPAALEGASLLARERRSSVTDRMGEKTCKKWKRLLDEPGICVWPAGRNLVMDPAVIGVHDPTEGGVATALHELADAAGTGLRVERGSIPFPVEFQSFCGDLGFDPMGVLSSGCLLLVVERGRADGFRSRHGTGVRSIGRLSEAGERQIRSGDTVEPLSRFDQDRLLPLLDELT